jgi:hypothetical protein
MSKPKLVECSFTFTQNGNTNGTTEEVEELKVSCESSLGIDEDGGCFYVLRSETGWSIDNLDELKELLNRIKHTI